MEWARSGAEVEGCRRAGLGLVGEAREIPGKEGAGKHEGYGWDGGELPAPEESPCRGKAWSVGSWAGGPMAVQEAARLAFTQPCLGTPCLRKFFFFSFFFCSP